MKRTVCTLVTVMAVALATIAADAPSVTGAWTMNVEGGPHGNATMGLTLKQDGTKVTGTFASGHAADMEVAGEFVDGELKIETTAGHGDDKILFSAKLKDDGTLAGYISSQMGDMKWTASRVPDEKKK
jgi:opacity protein-like surface antigen